MPGLRVDSEEQGWIGGSARGVTGADNYSSSPRLQGNTGEARPQRSLRGIVEIAEDNTVPGAGINSQK